MWILYSYFVGWSDVGLFTCIEHPYCSINGPGIVLAFGESIKINETIFKNECIVWAQRRIIISLEH